MEFVRIRYQIYDLIDDEEMINKTQMLSLKSSLVILLRLRVMQSKN